MITKTVLILSLLHIVPLHFLVLTLLKIPWFSNNKRKTHSLQNLKLSRFNKHGLCDCKIFCVVFLGQLLLHITVSNFDDVDLAMKSVHTVINQSGDLFL
jgi:hypothetical protein